MAASSTATAGRPRAAAHIRPLLKAPAALTACRAGARTHCSARGQPQVVMRCCSCFASHSEEKVVVTQYLKSGKKVRLDTLGYRPNVACALLAPYV